jgi:hypothetical protein
MCVHILHYIILYHIILYNIIAFYYIIFKGNTVGRQATACTFFQALGLEPNAQLHSAGACHLCACHPC